MLTQTRNAYAKINLGLDVVGVREDGYHLLRMIMQQISLFDTLSFTIFDYENADGRSAFSDGRNSVDGAFGGEICAAGGSRCTDGQPADPVRHSDTRAAGGSGLPDALPADPVRHSEIRVIDESGLSPAGEDNLVTRAIRMMLERCRIRARVEVRIVKRIPVAAGLAGGSTDAAAAFLAMRDLLAPQMEDRELMELGVRLGADIPYCIAGGTKLAEGIGERLTELAPMPDCAIILVKPEASASTAGVYRALDGLGEYRHPDIDGQIAALAAGDLEGLARRCENVLELVTGRSLPIIGRIEGFFTERGALAARMSGSGPSVFAIFQNVEDAERAREEFLRSELAAGCRAFLCSPVR